MAENVMSLFEEYVASLERGKQPDLRAYLERAGEDGDELARLVDVWLQVVPAPEPSVDAVEETRAWLAGEPPVLSLRSRRGLTRRAVVDAIIERFGFDPSKREKVRRYYHEVETGQLSPTPRVREALQGILGAPVNTWKPRPIEAASTYFRTEALAAAAPAVPAEEWDEVDELFKAAG